MRSVACPDLASLLLKEIAVRRASRSRNLSTPRSRRGSLYPVNATEKEESKRKLPVPACTLEGLGMRFRAGCCPPAGFEIRSAPRRDRKSTRLNSSHGYISYAVFCLKKKNNDYHVKCATYICTSN